MRLATIAVMALLAVPAEAASVRLDIPPGTLRAAVLAVGEQARVTIGIADPTLGNIMVGGVRGRLSAKAALARIVRGTGADIVAIDVSTFRVVRRVRAIPLPPPLPAGAVAQPAISPIVVTAGKRDTLLSRYPGGVSVTSTGVLSPISLLHGSEALLAQQPVLAATHLGPGRNKLFIRGIADSSFNGPSQATVGQYLGEIRLNYNAPDPDLALYDIASVEVLEGPQGTLYGAGSIGGIVRLVPTSPDLDRRSVELSVGGAVASEGAPSGDASGIVNLPIVRDRLALRAVAYVGIDGGYIDDPGRGLTDINRTDTRGGRATLRFQPASDWTIDLGGVVQNINSRDGQYDERDLPPLQRRSVLAQPFDNDYSLASLVVRHDIGAMRLLSATSAVFHDVGTVYDASPSPAAPVRYQEDNSISLLSNETRLSREGANGGGWVIGVQLLRNVDRLARMLGPPGDEARIAGTRNITEEASLYGEATLALSPRWSVTGSGRLGYLRSAGTILDDPNEGDAPTSHALSLLPSLGLLWRPGRALTVYARYQQGYRPGGLSVQQGTVQRFHGDEIRSLEAGVRFHGVEDAFSAVAAFSYARWSHIQADLVETNGLPYTANIGAGFVVGGEFQASWRPAAGLSLDAALFVDHSRLDDPAAGFEGERDATLPNIAAVIGRISMRYDLAIGARHVLLSTGAYYVGRSRLGVGTALDLHQGAYLQTNAGASTQLGRFTVSLDATNLLNERRNIFALGDPFGVAQGLQRTPLRPRTIRLGTSIAF